MYNILNRQYDAAHQSFGIVLHVFDYTEDKTKKWLPCPSDHRCHSATQRDRWTGSFLYKGMPFANKNNNLPIFADGIRGGIVYNISYINIRCIYEEDGNSRYKSEGCIPMCTGKKCKNHSI